MNLEIFMAIHCFIFLALLLNHNRVDCRYSRLGRIELGELQPDSDSAGDCGVEIKPGDTAELMGKAIVIDSYTKDPRRYDPTVYIFVEEQVCEIWLDINQTTAGQIPDCRVTAEQDGIVDQILGNPAKVFNFTVKFEIKAYMSENFVYAQLLSYDYHKVMEGLRFRMATNKTLPKMFSTIRPTITLLCPNRAVEKDCDTEVDLGPFHSMSFYVYDEKYIRITGKYMMKICLHGLEIRERHTITLDHVHHEIRLDGCFSVDLHPDLSSKQWTLDYEAENPFKPDPTKCPPRKGSHQITQTRGARFPQPKTCTP